MPHNIYAAARGNLQPGQSIPHWNELTPDLRNLLAIIIRQATAMGMESGAAGPNAALESLMRTFGMDTSKPVSIDEIVLAAKAKFSPAAVTPVPQTEEEAAAAADAAVAAVKEAVEAAAAMPSPEEAARAANAAAAAAADASAGTTTTPDAALAS